MTFTELYQKYLSFLWSAFQYDMEVFSKPWLYAWFIPVMIYLMIFLMKWIALTFPIWGPFAIAFGSLAHLIDSVVKARVKLSWCRINEQQVAEKDKEVSKPSNPPQS